MRDALNRRAKTFRDLCHPDPVTDEEFFRAVAEEGGLRISFDDCAR